MALFIVDLFQAIRKMNEEYKELKANATEGLADVENLRLEFMKLDLASFQSIKDFVEAFKRSGRQLHVLVCNAGLMKATFGEYFLAGANLNTEAILNMTLYNNNQNNYVIISRISVVAIAFGIFVFL